MGAPIVLQHHDSFILEVPEERMDHWAGAMRNVMQEPVEFPSGRKVVFTVSMKTGLNWGRYNTTANPGGLKSI